MYDGVRGCLTFDYCLHFCIILCLPSGRVPSFYRDNNEKKETILKKSFLNNPIYKLLAVPATRIQSYFYFRIVLFLNDKYPILFSFKSDYDIKKISNPHGISKLARLNKNYHLYYVSICIPTTIFI